MKRNMLPVLFGIGVLVLASLACQTLAGGGPALPQAGSPQDSGILFRDDFSDTGSGWDTVRTEEGITDYENGAYRIFVNIQNNDVWANPGLSFTDVHIAVDATKLGGPDDNDFGVICRYQDQDNFYFFLISSDGFYGIGKVANGEQQLLGAEGMSQSDAIRQGAATNHIEAECNGSQLRLWANGTLLFTTEDTEFSSGDVGLMAGTFDTVGTDISFDDFVVTRP